MEPPNFFTAASCAANRATNSTGLPPSAHRVTEGSALLSLAFVSIHTSVMVLDFLRELESNGATLSSAASAAPALAGALTLGNLAQDGCMVVLPTLVTLALALAWHTVKALKQ